MVEPTRQISKGAFLDRDGVINGSKVVNGVPKSPTSIAEVEILDGVVEAIKLLKNHEFTPVVITNQPDIARGLLSRSDLENINRHIGSLTGIEYFYTCPHDDEDMCRCRKPKPGLLFQAAEDLDLDLANSFLIGDRWRDISAGQASDCRCFFIDYSYPEKRPQGPFTKVSSLLEAVRVVTGVQNAD